MSNIIGVPITRVSDQFVRQRLLQQIQFDQKDLFRIQTQLSTGRRFEMPSEDPVSALRVMSLQRLLERKEQMRTNLTTNQSFLTATDITLSTTAELITEIRGVAMEVIGTTASDVQRKAAAEQVTQAISQLTDTGNTKFRGRYLFAGSTTLVRPFQTTEAGFVEYLGNEKKLLSYSDIDLLFETNVPGSEVFGAISGEVRGSVDLDPILTYNTRLADLDLGKGIGPGSIAVSDGNSTSIVDLSSAETIGDVAAMIRANPPGTRSLDVEITPTGLKIQLDSAPGDLTIREVGGGTTASELGILTDVGVGNNAVVGSDLDPILRTTTLLADVLGARARAVVRPLGPDNDFILEADLLGQEYNGVTITFVDDPLVEVEHEVVTYDDLAKTIEVRIDEYHTRAENVLKALNDAHAAGDLPFTARMDPLDGQSGGQGMIVATPPGQTAGQTAEGSGGELDRDSGFQITNGGQTHTILLMQGGEAKTIEDLLNKLNGSGAGVLAEINGDCTGIDVRSRVSGADFAIGENGGTTATQLGIRTFTADVRLEELNFGRGVEDAEESGSVASATYSPNGTDNDLLFRSRQTGSQWNDFTVSFVDSGGGPGSESLSYDTVAKEIVFEIVPGSTTANDLVQLFETSAGAKDDFEISLAAQEGSANSGAGTMRTGSVTTTDGRTPGVDFFITRSDGVILEVDLAGATTVGDVLKLINNHPDNGGPSPVLARLATHGNGIELVDDNPGNQTLTVTRDTTSMAAIDLGLIPKGQQSSTTGGQPAVLVGTDVSVKETEGVFTALLRLGTALEKNDLGEMQRATEMLYRQMLAVNFTRAEVGARQQGLDALQQRQDAEELELREALSLEHDADLVEVVSNLTARQVALEAGLRSIAQIFQMTLLNYL